MTTCGCGKTLKALYYTPSLTPESVDEFRETDFWYCPNCDAVYHRRIKTKVFWEPMIVGEEKR